MAVSKWVSVQVSDKFMKHRNHNINPLCFQARDRRRRPDLALVFWVHFVL